MRPRRLIILMKSALELHNRALKELADSGDAGNWRAELQPEYIQALAAIKAADVFLQPRPPKPTKPKVTTCPPSITNSSTP